MAVSPPPVSTPVGRLLFRLGGGAYRWTEEYFVTVASLTQQNLDAVGIQLANRRRPFLHQSLAVNGFETSVFDPGTGVRNPDFGPVFRNGAAWGCGTGTSANLTARPWVDATFRQYDRSSRYHRQITFRGLPSQAAVFAAVGPGALGKTADADALDAFFQVISNCTALPSGVAPAVVPTLRGLAPVGVGAVSSPSVGIETPSPLVSLTVPVGLQFLIRGRSYDTGFTNPIAITAVAPDATGCYTVITLATVPTYQVGQSIHVGGIRTCGLQGINGDTKVLAVNGQQVTINKKNCCCASAATVNAGGQASSIVYKFWVVACPGQTAANLLGSISSRKTGKTPARSRGRRRKRCKNRR
jgi:hypothetical protein